MERVESYAENGGGLVERKESVSDENLRMGSGLRRFGCEERDCGFGCGDLKAVVVQEIHERADVVGEGFGE